MSGSHIGYPGRHKGPVVSNLRPPGVGDGSEAWTITKALAS